ncbi:hypothetical protein H6CHR_01855 [Variovorax sp. PBL-H6]|uniref:hypothetical protein n=1 Tax=Variovorax sp. PBL-H6 TaxID=434009 RepID=UPI0013190308|nr:hypothetical protein [Variovorax sp. PBL-H6]VTU22777.1 hypothetical protein H6CHR_01855 [Variovorax sp. PBL-H6]
MTDRIDKKDKHQPPALIKARPNAMAHDFEAFDRNRFEALLQGAGDMTDTMPEPTALARSPLTPRPNAVPADDPQAEPQDEATASTARPTADAVALPSPEDHPSGSPKAVSDGPTEEAEEEHELNRMQAAPGAQATLTSLDPRVLDVQRKRKLQMQMKMHEDAARTLAQAQAPAAPAQQLPPPSGTVPDGKASSALRADEIGAVRKADLAAPTAPASPLPSPSPSPSQEMPEMTELTEIDALSPAPEQDESTQQHRHHQSQRQEIVAAEAGAAQVVQQQILAQRNMPESLPLHLLESI